MNTKVSVIVPVYGVEKYLRQCVDSIRRQTLEDIQIILVDDGSNDGCGAIIDEYAALDPRVIAVHQENAGYGRAVNRGISLARGEYMAIVEPDDFIEPDMYESLYADAKAFDADVVKGMYKEYYDTPAGGEARLPMHAPFMSPVKNPFNIFESPFPLNWHASIWSAIYRLEFIRKNAIKMPEINKGRYMDQVWRYETLLLSNKVYWQNRPFYNYRITNESASSFKRDNPDDIFAVYEILEEFFAKHPGMKERIKDNLYAEIFWHMRWNIERLSWKYKPHCFFRIVRQFGNLDRNAIKNSKILARKERRDFLEMLSYPGLVKHACKSAIKNIFSVCNSSDKTRKIITILGVGIELERKARRRGGH